MREGGAGPIEALLQMAAWSWKQAWAGVMEMGDGLHRMYVPGMREMKQIKNIKVQPLRYSKLFM
jgi:hypothetical protein